jgi:hypothetical protein
LVQFSLRVQGARDPALQDAESSRVSALTHRTLMMAQLDQFVSDVEGRHDGDSVSADNAPGLAHFAHAPVHQSGGLQQAILFLGVAGDAVLLIQNAYRDRDLFLLHRSSSMDLRRVIMDSTLLRASSVFSTSWARSSPRVDLTGAQPGIFLTQAITDLDEFIHLLFKGFEYRIGSRFSFRDGTGAL